MEKNRYNILLSCYSGEKDSGDETMLLCIREQLEAELGCEVSCTAFSNNPEISKEFHDNITFLYSGRYGLKQPGKKGMAAFGWIKQMLAAIKNCDILLTGGGTVMYDESNKFFVPFWFIKIFFAQMRRKPTAFYGIGVGPLNRKFSKFLMNTIGQKMSFISLRGVKSKEWMDKFKVPKNKVFLTADPAVTIYPSSDEQLAEYYKSVGINPNDGRQTVVIVAREWFTRSGRGLEQAQNGEAKIKSYEDYIHQMALFGKYIVEEENCDIIFMPMGSLPPCDDTVVLYAIRDEMEKMGVDMSGVFNMPDITDSRIMTAIMAKSKAVITGRFHGLVYSTTQYVPAIGLAYTEKYYDYYDYIGLSDYIISMNDLSFEALKEKYEYMTAHKSEFLDVLKREIPKQIENAKKNAKLVRCVLEKKDLDF